MMSSATGRRRVNIVTLLLLGACPAAADDRPLRHVDFTRDVWPLLQRSCLECHGAKKQEGDLRLDRRASALRAGDNAVVAPGNADQSELIRRVSLPRGDGQIMPARGEPLTPSEIKLLRDWINQGADWPESAFNARHWSYVAPVRPESPTVQDAEWVHTPVDGFILARLEREGLRPSPEADRATLIRRLSLDLIGLPPTPAEVDDFINDASPRAYEALVDRLLASDQFGVRWARPWLDYAHYADSHGFQRDDFRDLWPYRDWVVDALNADMPFDRFTIEQLAGDLLPDATESQRIATGFGRCAPCNVEAGSEPEETRVNQVFDRVNTVGMVWLGTTLECCQCHDHKYDPFTMRDYYGLFAFFNNTEIEADRANPNVPGSIRFLGPEMELADPAVTAARDRLQQELTSVKDELAQRAKELETPDAAWETALRAELAAAPREHLLKVTHFESLGGATHEVLEDGSVLLSGEAPDRDTYTVEVETDVAGIRAIKLETLTDPSLPGQGPGRGDAQRPNFVLHTFAAEARPRNGGEAQTVAFTSATADFSQKNLNVAGAIDADPKTGWAINPKFHAPHWALFETAAPLGFDGSTVLTFRLEQNFGGSRTIGRLRLSAVTGNVGGESISADVAAVLETPVESRTPEQIRTLAKYRQDLDELSQKLTQQVTKLEADLKAINVPTTLVMRERAEPRRSTLFTRGDYRNPGHAIDPATPALLPSPQSTNDRQTRLDLARWLVSRDNPLTARVVVNRWWAELFGHGLVTTPEDFGIKGDRPTHPELLDWLAAEFMDHGWSMKHVLKSIVMSATYRQSSRVTSELLVRDDGNRLYARGPRFRMDAEMVRDNALAIAGLLSLKLGGPPVRPYQPDGIWIKVGGQRYDYEVSPGEDQYRRGLYVVWKRGAPYPSFINFDANNRLACRVKRQN
jgi:hypothetical protein